MANNTSMNIRMDKDIKEQAQKLFAQFGLDMTTAVNMFLRQSIRENRIPFALKLIPDFVDTDNGNGVGFTFSDQKELVEGLDKAERQIASGKHYTLDEVMTDLRKDYGTKN